MFRLRKSQQNKHREEKDVITWRGHEITRIEAFSDAVFALAITLLAVSMDVPKTYAELTNLLKGFVPFAVCFLLFFQVWSAQNLFFRRYGLHDERTIALNAMLLLSVLFFVDPLKFLWTLLFQSGGDINGREMQQLMYIYGMGFIVIYVLLALMYRHANVRADHLKLTPQEAFETRTYMYRNFGVASVGILSMAIASVPIPFCLILSGISYSAIALVVRAIIKKRDKMVKKLFVPLAAAPASIENEPSGEKVEE